MRADADLKRRLRGLRELGSLVRSLKLLSAASLHRFERAVAGLAESVEVLESALAVVLARGVPGMEHPGWTEARGEPGLTAGVVLGSDHGLCGAWHESLARFVRAWDPVPVPLMAVGSRLASALDEAGVSVDVERPGLSTLAALAPGVQDLVLRLEEWRQAGLVQRLLVFHQRPDPAGQPRPTCVQLLPLDPAWLEGLAGRAWGGPTLPWCAQEPEVLLPLLVRQHLFLTLYRAQAEALASENGARFAAMQAAERNLEERQAELEREYHRQRQGLVTEELLDVVAGYEASGPQGPGLQSGNQEPAGGTRPEPGTRRRRCRSDAPDW